MKRINLFLDGDSSQDASPSCGGKYAAWTKNRTGAALAAMEDAYEIINALRPAVSRVTLTLKKDR